MRSNPPDELSTAVEVPHEIEAELARRRERLGHIGARVHWLRSAGSTNDIAARLADLGAVHGTAVVAEAQTAGRGRMGRTWFSPPGAGLYVSLILRPSEMLSENVSSPALLTLASGVALADGVKTSTGLTVEIKWPNDLLVAKRKLAGILTEAAAQAGRLQFVILGFGINVSAAAYPPELANRVTSLEAELGRPVDRALVFAEALAAISERYADLQRGRFDAILGAWRRHAPSMRGSLVEWDTAAGPLRGRAEDVDEHGALVVRVGDRIERLVAGEIRWL